MAEAPWVLDEGRALLETEWLRGTVRPATPQHGITQLAWHDMTQSCRLLGVSFPQSCLPRAGEIDDLYVRGNDLVVTYAEVARRPYRCQTYWRLQSPAGGQGVSHGAIVLDLVVSAETSRLDLQLDLGVVFSFSSGATISPPVDLDVPSSGLPIRQGESDIPSCCLVATQETGQPNMAMMVHPDDYRDVRLDTSASQQDPIRVTFPIFGHRIEKGVIMRARARCVLFASETDRAALLAWQSDLLHVPLPLTT